MILIIGMHTESYLRRGSCVNTTIRRRGGYGACLSSAVFITHQKVTYVVDFSIFRFKGLMANPRNHIAGFHRGQLVYRNHETKKVVC